MRTALMLGTLTALAACAGLGRAAAPDFLLPDNPVLPEGLGVNIHFTDPRPGEMEMLAAGGVTRESPTQPARGARTSHTPCPAHIAQLVLERSDS